MKIPGIALTAIFCSCQVAGGDEESGKELGWAGESPFAKSICKVHSRRIQAEQQTPDLNSVAIRGGFDPGQLGHRAHSAVACCDRLI